MDEATKLLRRAIKRGGVIRAPYDRTPGIKVQFDNPADAVTVFSLADNAIGPVTIGGRSFKVVVTECTVEGRLTIRSTGKIKQLVQ